MSQPTRPTGKSGFSSGLERELSDAIRWHQAGELRRAETGYREILQNQPENHQALQLLGVLMHQSGHQDLAQQLIQAAIKLDGANDTYYFNLAEIQRSTGFLQVAAQNYRKAIEIGPEEADYFFGLGTLLDETGDIEAAVIAFRQAIRLSPDDPQTHNNLGNALAANGDLDKAMYHFHEAIVCDAGYVEAHVNLGNLLNQRGEHELAIASYREALELLPDDARAQYNIALGFEEAGLQSAAVSVYRQAIALDPGMALAHANLGRLLREMNDLESAAKSYRAALAIEPDMSIALNGLAAVQRDGGDFAGAADAYRQLLETNPVDVNARRLLGDCLTKLDQYDEALVQFERALTIEPDNAETCFNRGICLQSMGNFGEAAVCHRRALELKPTLAEAAYNLMLIDSTSMDAIELENLLRLSTADGLDSPSRINLHFALAKAFKDRGRHDEAFGQLRAGNDLKAREKPFQPEAYANYIERVIASFDEHFFDSHRGYGLDTEVPVFIVGMPRSGSTLVEQIISSHPRAYGAGELNDMRILQRRLPEMTASGKDEPECVGDISAELTRQLANQHLDKLGRLSGGAQRVCDKMLGNFLKLGLIFLLFPRARIIHCQRHPLDMGLSCYFQNFARGLRFSYRLEHLGLAYRGYHKLMQHWRQVLPLRMLEVRYERLVEDQEQVSREMIEFCGLDWDPRCLEFHRQSRGVKTASFWQVRQPLYQSSVGQWQDYRRQLAPLADVLSEFAHEYPDSPR